MLNVECVDKKENGVEIVFSDPDGDEAIKVCVSEKTAWNLEREIQRQRYAAKKE